MDQETQQEIKDAPQQTAPPQHTNTPTARFRAGAVTAAVLALQAAYEHLALVRELRPTSA